ncbi:MAG: sulfite exporter TauE/SafE family protein [Pseudomonadota bacterium]
MHRSRLSRLGLSKKLVYLAFMGDVLELLSPDLWLAAMLVAFAGGVVKGVVGFAMPLVILSGLAAFTTPDLAIAGIILPTLVSNVFQSLIGGIAPARRIVRDFKLFLIVSGVFLLIGAQLVPLFSETFLLLALGCPTIAFVISQLLGWLPAQMRQSVNFDVIMGVIAGIFGGIAGIWGPPTVAYLTALGTPKVEQIQAQGVFFLAGSILLVVAHVTSGILTTITCAFSALLVLPALAGLAVGTMIQGRINQIAFRRATLLVLLLAGANLVRRGLIL